MRMPGKRLTVLGVGAVVVGLVAGGVMAWRADPVAEAASCDDNFAPAEGPEQVDSGADVAGGWVAGVPGHGRHEVVGVVLTDREAGLVETYNEHAFEGDRGLLAYRDSIFGSVLGTIRTSGRIVSGGYDAAAHVAYAAVVDTGDDGAQTLHIAGFTYGSTRPEWCRTVELAGRAVDPPLRVFGGGDGRLLVVSHADVGDSSSGAEPATELLRVEAGTGEVVWTASVDHHVGSVGFAEGAVVVAQSGAIVYEGGGATHVTALSDGDGAQLWGDTSAGNSTVLGSSDEVTVVAHLAFRRLGVEASLVGYRPDEGQVLWTTELPADSAATPGFTLPVAMAPSGDLIVNARDTADGPTTMIDAYASEDGTRLWGSDAPGLPELHRRGTYPTPSSDLSLAEVGDNLVVQAGRTVNLFDRTDGRRTTRVFDDGVDHIVGDGSGSLVLEFDGQLYGTSEVAITDQQCFSSYRGWPEACE